uniref:Uncharacterized protein n=1 Tax=uncultured marine virus TaxID=186617 RepID=A0A0F7L9E4_9VIRU|nr:hypothetical protein [uncultured marine virus]
MICYLNDTKIKMTKQLHNSRNSFTKFVINLFNCKCSSKRRCYKVFIRIVNSFF